MMIPNNYEINVARKTPQYMHGKHYCNIELGDILEENAIEIYKELCEIFPDDFLLDLHKVTCYGTLIRNDER